MTTNRCILLFRLKKTTNHADGDMMLVYMRITIASTRSELSTGRKFDPSRWNKRAGRAIGNKEDAKTLNAYLDMLQNKVYEAHRELLALNEPVTAVLLRDKLQGKSAEQKRMLLEVFAEHNRQMVRLIENEEYASGTLTHFETTYKHVQSFIKWKYKADDMAIENADYAFISDFEYYLKAEVCAHNTTMKYLGDLKKILLLCVKRGWLPKDPFLGYKMSRREVPKDFLVDHELQAMEGKKFLSERLTLVRDVFLFSCYTGLAYADVKKLKLSEIRIGIDGSKWLFIERQKSSTPSPVPLLPVALSILEKYKDHPRCINSDRALPVLCNQKMNEYLKEIADVCGISKKLTYHTARHTFATTVTLNNNVPIESVSKMLGHKSLKQTQHYAKVLNKKIGEDMQILKSKFSEKTKQNLKAI
jgi:site-specific recombinase XerD